MVRDYSNRTYRVRQLPSHLSRDTVPGFLVKWCPTLGSKDNITVCSLASSLMLFENPRTKTATIIFMALPAIFDNDQSEWVIPTTPMQPSIIVDVHFLGFTALNEVDPGSHSLE
jgi:hypothetical protein